MRQKNPLRKKLLERKVGFIENTAMFSIDTHGR